MADKSDIPAKKAAKKTAKKAAKKAATKKVLDLLDDSPKKKPSRRERQRQEAEPKESQVQKAKAGALDIFSEDTSKKLVKKASNPNRRVLPSISKVNEPAALEPDLVKPADDAPLAAPTGSGALGDGEGISEVSEDKIISIKPPIIVSELADKMSLKPFQVMADLIKLQVFVAPNAAIDPEIAAQVCENHGFVFEREKRERGGGVHKEEEVIAEPEPEEEQEEEMILRAPIITFMGHVDHGKTSLLDYIRNSRVTAKEAGGITQHIGAYSVEQKGQPVTFIDTPGHAIFSSMRSRGADITDIIVIVVAADDGLMPQTREAIDHAKRAKKTIIVAINKCDLPAADPNRVKTQLLEVGLQPTDFGGDTECVEVSATKGDGVEDLLDLLALQAEVLELKASPDANPRAVVIEAKVEPGRGPTASVIVETGTLKRGASFICGPFAGKIKSLLGEDGKQVKEVGPGLPTQVLGFAEVPNVGDEMVVMDSDKAAKKLSNERQSELRENRLVAPVKSRMEDLLSFAHDGNQKARLNLILKGDVQGTIQAIVGAVEEIESEKVEAKFIASAAGAISENDILMASSADAIVLGFNTKVEPKAVAAAKREGVQIKLYTIVYELLDQVKEAMLGLLDPETRETVIGHAEVKQVFRVVGKSNKARAAGCIITDGKVSRKAHARVLRGGIPVFDGKMSTLRRFQDEVDEVKQGIECGIRLGSFDGYEEGDVIECYTLEKIDQTL